MKNRGTFWVLWLIGNAAGWTLAAAIGSSLVVLGWPQVKLQWLFDHLPEPVAGVLVAAWYPLGAVVFLLMAAATCAAAAASVGVLQALAVSTRFRALREWTVATVRGTVLGVLVGSAVFYPVLWALTVSTRGLLPSIWRDIVAWTTLAVVGGLWIGIEQQKVLRRHGLPVGYWVSINGTTWGVAGFMALAAGGRLHRPIAISEFAGLGALLGMVGAAIAGPWLVRGLFSTFPTNRGA